MASVTIVSVSIESVPVFLFYDVNLIYSKNVRKVFKFVCENDHIPVEKIPAIVHKVDAHVGEIIIHSPAPHGILAVEVAESQHKQFKIY